MSTATRVLTHGRLSFTADVGGGDGPLVLCLHGFPDHRRTWRHQLQVLIDAGYRVVAPDLRGYEPSSQPADGDYHLVRGAEDVLAWLDELGVERAHLLGHDWGAVIAYTAASLAPHRFISATTLAVPPLRRIPSMLAARPTALTRLWYMQFFQIRRLSERVLLAHRGAFLRWLWARWSPGWQCPEEELDAIVTRFERPGVARSALGYYRALLDGITSAGRQSWRLLLGRVDVPTLVISGAADGCMDSAVYEAGIEPRDFPGGVRFERVEGAGHFLHLERPTEVNALILDWLATHTPA